MWNNTMVNRSASNKSNNGSKSNKPSPPEQPSPWGWASAPKIASGAKPTEGEIYRAYRLVGYPRCIYYCKRNCRKNPYCLWGLCSLNLEKKENGKGGNVDDNKKETVVGTIKEEEEPDNNGRGENEIVGIQNLGNTCYVNSLLQLWFHNPIICPAVLRWRPPESDETAITDFIPCCAISQLQAMFARLKISKRKAIDARPFVDALQLDAGEQQDAQEFSKLLMQKIIENPINNNNQISQNFKNCFTGESQFETVCESCHHVSIGGKEEFTELTLPVKKTLMEALKEVCDQESKLENDNQYYCTKCNGKQDATRSMKILKLPTVLNIQLLRFVYDNASRDRRKVQKAIEFPEVLDMTQFVPEVYRQDEETYIYQLNAVLIHNGRKVSQGHYISHIKDVKSGTWFECNDDSIAKIDKKKYSKNDNNKTLTLSEDGDDEESINGSTVSSSGNPSSTGAYMLVYTKQADFIPPNPEPEVPEYLKKIVHQEDLEYELGIQEEKARKEEEIMKKTQRQMIIDSLYEAIIPAQFKKEPSSASASGSSSSSPEASKENTFKIDDRDSVLDPYQSSMKTKPKKVVKPLPPDPMDMDDTLPINEDPDVTAQELTITNMCRISTRIDKDNRSEAMDMQETLPIEEEPKVVIRNLQFSASAFYGTSTRTDREMKADARDMEVTPSKQRLASVTSASTDKDKKPKTNGIGNISGTTPSPVTLEKAHQLCSDLEFIPSSWLEQFLKSSKGTSTEVPTLDNSKLICPHEKVKPPKRNDSNPAYKLVPVTFADQVYEKYGLEKSNRLKVKTSLCTKCVNLEAKLINDLEILDADYKEVQRLVKEIELAQMKDKDWKEDPSFTEDKLWIGKSTLKSWRKNAKEKMEYEDDEEVEILDEFQFNGDLLCKHEALTTDKNTRRLIDMQAWSIICKYFPEAEMFPYCAPECQECLSNDKANSVVKEQNRAIAIQQRHDLQELYFGRSRPSYLLTGVYYIVPTSFLKEWRQFIKEPLIYDNIEEIRNRELICDDPTCSHDKPSLKYSIEAMHLKEYRLSNAEDKMALIRKEEMRILLQSMTVDIPIQVKIHEILDGPYNKKLDYKYNIPTCTKSINKWIENLQNEKYTYSSGNIYIKLIQDEAEVFETDVGPPAKTAKMDFPFQRNLRDRTVRRPVQAQQYKSTPSTMKIRDFQVHNLSQTYKAMLSDQHLYFDGRELTYEEKSKTFNELKIPSESTIYLRIDKPNSQQDMDYGERDSPTQTERGFSGTALASTFPVTTNPTQSSGVF